MQKLDLDLPHVLPCRLSHVRLFPRFHRFEYSYLTVHLSVTWQGKIGKRFSAGSLENDTKSWFHVDPAHHLQDDLPGTSLREKLDKCLRHYVGLNHVHHLPLSDVVRLGFRPRGCFHCISSHVAGIPRLPIQPRLILVSLLEIV